VQEHDDLNTEEAKRFIADAADMGSLHMSFSGGEPFLRKDLFELISHARDLGLSTSVNTNGTRLVDPRHAKAACRAGLGAAFVSLDGADPETHNRLRGMGHAFSSAIRAIDNLLEQRDGGKPAVYINTTVTQGNVDNLEGILGLARQHQVDGMTLSVVQGTKKYSPDSGIVMKDMDVNDLGRRLRALAKDSGGLIPHSDEYLECFQTYLQSPKTLYRYRCAAGYSTVVIHPNGEVHPCPVPFASMGSLRRQSFKEIWRSEQSSNVRKLIKADEHPICWFDCIAPLNVLLHNISGMKLHKVLHAKTIRHILKRAEG